LLKTTCGIIITPPPPLKLSKVTSEQDVSLIPGPSLSPAQALNLIPLKLVCVSVKPVIIIEVEAVFAVVPVHHVPYGTITKSCHAPPIYRLHVTPNWVLELSELREQLASQVIVIELEVRFEGVRVMVQYPTGAPWFDSFLFNTT
jgi:hypothetical protein